MIEKLRGRAKGLAAAFVVVTIASVTTLGLTHQSKATALHSSGPYRSGLIDPSRPTVPAVGDRCFGPPEANGRVTCWWVPEGHHSIAFSVRSDAATPADTVRFEIRNKIDGLTARFNLARGHEQALPMRGGDELILNTGAYSWRALEVRVVN